MPALLSEFLQSSSPEVTFLMHLDSAIAGAREKRRRRAGTSDAASASPASNSPSRFAFKPLLLGYNGAANTGADVRVIEMLRQFRHLFAHVDFDPVLLSSGPDFNHAEFHTVRKLEQTMYFPEFLSECLQDYTGVVACEGSMFTSTFSDGLAGMFAGSLGYATALGDLGVGYGAEVAAMSPALERFVSSTCNDALVIARNRASLNELSQLGMRAQQGADPAWTFEPESTGARALLREAGWNGHDPIVALCPINPFCWPVVIDVERGSACTPADMADEWQRDAISFHTWSDHAAKKYDTYLAGFAELIKWLRDRRYFTLLVGMQDIDRASCVRLNALLPSPAPVFVRGANSIDEITGLLHRAALVISSRFHAALLGMSAGTPCIGISMDSRIDTLFSENGLQEWLIACDSDNLGDELISRASRIRTMSDQLGIQYGNLAARQIRLFGEMGMHLMAETRAVYPDCPPSPLATSWDAYLPPLSKRVENLLTRHA